MISKARRGLLPLVLMLPTSCLPRDYLGLGPPERDERDAAVDTGFGFEDGPPREDSGPACQPPDGRLPYVSAAPREPVCTANEIDALADCLARAENGVLLRPLASCLDGGDLSEACRRCVVTPASAPLWGPLVIYERGIVRPNVGGCVERTVPRAAPCSAPADAHEQCVHVRACACSDRASCRVEASAGPCAPELDTLDACLADAFRNGASREAYQACAPKADRTYWRRQLALFCGP
jgi:hypothetical protein